MNSDELSKIAVELDGIFDNMPIELVNKIPKDLIKTLNGIKHTSYQFNYDNTKTLKEQKISPKTKGILAYLYKEYICDDIEKKQYNQKYYEYIEEQEETKRKKYNPNNIFKSK